MSATLTASLNPLQKACIQSMCHSFPIDDAELFAIFEVDGTILSAAAFLCEGEETYECYAFTDPEFRQQGLFTELLDMALDKLPEDAEFLFYTNGSDPDTMAVLNALEAECILQEHMMELDLNSWRISKASMDEDEITMSLTFVDDTLTRRYESSCGSVYISVFSSYSAS